MHGITKPHTIIIDHHEQNNAHNRYWNESNHHQATLHHPCIGEEENNFHTFRNYRHPALPNLNSVHRIASGFPTNGQQFRQCLTLPVSQSRSAVAEQST